MAEHVCPWWLGYALINPFRPLRHNPKEILSDYVEEGMTVLDVGPGMGFFSLPMARMVGAKGRVVCVDLQEKMLAKLERRAAKAGLSETVESRLCSPDSLGIDDLAQKVDFALAFAVVHESPDKQAFVSQICSTLKPGAHLLIAEPKNHVSPELFQKVKEYVLDLGMAERGAPLIKGNLSALFSAPGATA